MGIITYIAFLTESLLGETRKIEMILFINVALFKIEILGYYFFGFQHTLGHSFMSNSLMH